MRKCKLLFAFILVFCLILPFCVSVGAAEDNTVVLSEDYSSVEYDGKVYTLFNYYASDVYLSGFELVNFDVALSDKQIEAIDTVSVYVSDIAVNLDIVFGDGGYSSLYYLSSDAEERINRFLAEGSGHYYTFSRFGTRLEMNAEVLFGERATLPASEYIRYSAVPVTEISADGLLEREAGEYVITEDGEVYYLDYASLGTSSSEFLPPLYGNLSVWKVTDSELLAKISSRDDITAGPGDGILIMLLLSVLVFVFGVIPLAALLVALILLPRLGQRYRRLLTLVSVLAALTLLLFIITAALFAVAI